MPASAVAATAVILSAGVLGILFACFLFFHVSRILVNPKDSKPGLMASINDEDAAAMARLYEIYENIRGGASAFLWAEYKICAVFLVLFGILVLIMTSYTADGWFFDRGLFTAISFLVGGVTSIASGYIGMTVAVYSNARTTVAAKADGWKDAFNTAFRAGGVMGFSLSGLALLVLYLLCTLLNLRYRHDEVDEDYDGGKNGQMKYSQAKILFECVSGYGLGGSSIAMFGRVGGGIYTKAADVGADLAGKVIENIPEDDPRNPATIADNVGDNVGDVAGMGSDLFGSFAEASCAALVVSTQSEQLAGNWQHLMFPLVISSLGIFVCIVTSFVATDVSPVTKEFMDVHMELGGWTIFSGQLSEIETVLKIQLGVSTLLMTVFLYPVANAFLPESFEIGSCGEGGVGSNCYTVTPVDAYCSIIGGLWAGCVIGFVTEYYTSHSYTPVREVANSCVTGAATNIIYGLALGYKSAIIPVTLIALAVFMSFDLCGMYGVALAALGMLSTLATCLTIDVYGPVCDNAGGIAEMSELPKYVREKTDALDAAGNTTAAIGKGFAIGSAALVALALFGAFVTRSGLEDIGINILRPIVFAWIFIGAMIPYWFTAMTMKSVGNAAMEMVEEVKRQFKEIPGLLQGTPGHAPADHDRCIKISTDASLREMVPPGLLVILTPILCGTFFGVEAVSGLLTGSITSGVQLAISQSNTGGAWDNAKKYVERGKVSEEVDGVMVVRGKGSEIHKAAVIGDTVGDPLKDTSGPALNIVMKLQAIISLVFADFFMSLCSGSGQSRQCGTGLFRVHRA